MTALEALTTLRQGNAKVKRKHWVKGEFVQSFSDGVVHTSKVYDQNRIKHCHYPDDTVVIMEWLWEDMTSDDWEVVLDES